MKYLLKFDVTSQPLDHNFGLPTEEICSPAVHPPVQILILENEQGLPQNVEVHASDKGSGIGVTVGDVLKTISVDLRKSCSQHEFLKLDEDTRREVEDALEDQRTEERTSGLLWMDYLHGRNRLLVFPKHPFPLPFNHTSSDVRGPSPKSGSWLPGHGHTSPPPPSIPAPQPVVSSGGYAPAESLPPQNYISSARTMPRLTMPFYPLTSHGTSVLTLATPTHNVPSPTAVVPPNSELARTPRFTFAPPGAYVPADPVVGPTGPSPTRGRRRDKERAMGKTDKASQLVAEGSGRRTSSNSWSVVSSVFRRRSGLWIYF